MDEEELRKQAQGLRNNQPAIIAEWIPMSRNALRRQLRENLGDLGDDLRRAGWAGMTMGPLTCAALDRFARRLAKALYFHENEERFEGAIFSHRHSITDGSSLELLREITRFAPMIAVPFRAGERLSDQFEYRFNASSSFGVLYAVVQFTSQMIFQIIALSHRAMSGINEHRPSLGEGPVSVDQDGVGLLF